MNTLNDNALFISVADVRPTLESMYLMRSEMVPCFIGAPGIGKTQGLYEFAESIGVNVVTFILSNTVPSEVSGIRMPDKDTKKMEVFDDMRMASLKDGDILFFDEILEAPPMLWSACLTLIQDRLMASGKKLPDVFIVAASNKVATPSIIPASTRNRFQFLQVRSDWNAWSTWFKDRFGIVPDLRLRPKLEEDSDQYNIFTPREAVKLYLWLKEAGATPFNLKLVSHMFDADIAKILRDMVNQKRSKQRQVMDAVWDVADIKLPPEFETMNIRHMLEELMKRDDWASIEKALSEVSFDTDEDDEVEIEF